MHDTEAAAEESRRVKRTTALKKALAVYASRLALEFKQGAGASHAAHLLTLLEQYRDQEQNNPKAMRRASAGPRKAIRAKGCSSDL